MLAQMLLVSAPNNSQCLHYSIAISQCICNTLGFFWNLIQLYQNSPQLTPHDRPLPIALQQKSGSSFWSQSLVRDKNISFTVELQADWRLMLVLYYPARESCFVLSDRKFKVDFGNKEIDNRLLS